MIRRFLLVRRLLPMLPLLAAPLAVGCGGAKSMEAPSSTPPPAQPEAYPQPGYAQPMPGGDAEAGGKGPAPPPAPPPSAAPYPNQTGTTERDLSTLAGALDAFEEDEIRLTTMLDDRTVQLSKQATCDRVCEALASMRRSADAICELAGQDDARCDAARTKLEGNETRITDAGCTCS